VASMAELAALAEMALLLVITLSLPVVGVAALVGVVVAGFQAATQLQDPTISHLPRMLAVALVLAVLAPWMGAEITGFAREAFAAR